MAKCHNLMCINSWTSVTLWCWALLYKIWERKSKLVTLNRCLDLVSMNWIWWWVQNTLQRLASSKQTQSKTLIQLSCFDKNSESAAFCDLPRLLVKAAPGIKYVPLSIKCSLSIPFGIVTVKMSYLPVSANVTFVTFCHAHQNPARKIDFEDVHQKYLYWV